MLRMKSLLTIFVIALFARGSLCKVDLDNRRNLAFLRPAIARGESPVQVLDQNGNFIGDLQVDPEKPAVGVALNADELAGTLQKEVIRAEVNGGKCRSFTGESVPFFDSPSDVGEVLSSVIVPEKGSVISASVELDLTHPRAGSAGISLIFGDESAEKPHIVLKEGCDPNSMSCDHFGKNMVNVLFSDEATSDFPEDENSAPFTGAYKPVQPLNLISVGGGETAGNGGSFGRFTLRANIPGVSEAPDMKWKLHICYVPSEPRVEAVVDNMRDLDGDVASDSVSEQEASAMAAGFIRRFSASRRGFVPAQARPFMLYMGRLFIQYATCYGVGEAYHRLETLYCNTFGGPIILQQLFGGIQFVTDPTCPTTIPPLSEWLTPFLTAVGSY